MCVCVCERESSPGGWSWGIFLKIFATTPNTIPHLSRSSLVIPVKPSPSIFLSLKMACSFGSKTTFWVARYLISASVSSSSKASRDNLLLRKEKKKRLYASGKKKKKERKKIKRKKEQLRGLCFCFRHPWSWRGTKRRKEKEDCLREKKKNFKNK